MELELIALPSSLALQGSVVLRYGHPLVAETYCASRLGGDNLAPNYGTLDVPTATLAGLVERAMPSAQRQQ